MIFGPDFCLGSTVVPDFCISPSSSHVINLKCGHLLSFLSTSYLSLLLKTISVFPKNSLKLFPSKPCIFWHLANVRYNLTCKVQVHYPLILWGCGVYWDVHPKGLLESSQKYHQRCFLFLNNLYNFRLIHGLSGSNSDIFQEILVEVLPTFIDVIPLWWFQKENIIQFPLGSSPPWWRRPWVTVECQTNWVDES